MYILFPEKNIIKQWQLLELTFRAQKWPRFLTPWDAEATGEQYFHSVHLIVYVFSTCLTQLILLTKGHLYSKLSSIYITAPD